MPDPNFVAKTHIFVPGTDIKSAEANQNFDDLVNYVNAYVVTRDGSQPFTSIPTVTGAAAVNPSSDNQLARKAYVDTIRSTFLGAGITVLSTATAQLATITANIIKRTLMKGAGLSITGGTAPSVATGQYQIIAGSSVNTLVNGMATVTLDGGGFTNGMISVVITSGDTSVPTHLVAVVSTTKTAFVYRAWSDSTIALFGTPVLDRSVGASRVNYVAVGW